MKTLKYILPIVLLVAFSQSSCSKDEDETTPVQATTPTELTEDEETDLIFMREEEKLARDVYLYAFDLYGIQIFSNISNSEQKHMDQILILLEAYNIPDPASPDKGVFNDANLQKLYNDLITQCDLSLLDALTAGATIEDVDIRDLNLTSSNTSKSDILLTYENLTCGSRNHMRAFVGQIENEGGTYAPQFITSTEYQAIIDGAHEKCGME